MTLDSRLESASSNGMRPASFAALSADSDSSKNSGRPMQRAPTRHHIWSRIGGLFTEGNDSSGAKPGSREVEFQGAATSRSGAATTASGLIARLRLGPACKAPREAPPQNERHCHLPARHVGRLSCSWKNSDTAYAKGYVDARANATKAATRRLRLLAGRRRYRWSASMLLDSDGCLRAPRSASPAALADPSATSGAWIASPKAAARPHARISKGSLARGSSRGAVRTRSWSTQMTSSSGLPTSIPSRRGRKPSAPTAISASATRAAPRR